MVNEILEDFSPEERHQIYKLLRLDVYACADQPLEIKGIFAILGDEAETIVCRPANSRRLAYKGGVADRTSEEVASGVR
jgi:hypothetical protein